MMLMSGVIDLSGTIYLFVSGVIIPKFHILFFDIDFIALSRAILSNYKSIISNIFLFLERSWIREAIYIVKV